MLIYFCRIIFSQRRRRSVSNNFVHDLYLRRGGFAGGAEGHCCDSHFRGHADDLQDVSAADLPHTLQRTSPCVVQHSSSSVHVGWQLLHHRRRVLLASRTEKKVFLVASARRLLHREGLGQVHARRCRDCRSRIGCGCQKHFPSAFRDRLGDSLLRHELRGA